MKAIVIKEPWVVETVEREIPKRQKGEALLKMVVGGVCGSDLYSYRGQSAYCSYPRTIGHEIAAEVVEVDDNEYGIRPGMLVIGNPYFNCGKCYACKQGVKNACINNETMGVQREGAFSEYFTMPVDRLFDGTGLEARELCLVEPFTISYHAVSLANPTPEDKTLVFGAGPIGILAAVSAKSFGAKAYITDVSAEKVEYAVKNFNLDGGFVNTGVESQDAFVQEITGGEGFNIIVEAAGVPESFTACVHVASSLGRMIVSGIPVRNANFNYLDIQRKELTIRGARGGTNDEFRTTLKLTREGFVDLKKLITVTYPIDHAEEAFKEIDKNSAKIIKAEFEFVK